MPTTTRLAHSKNIEFISVINFSERLFVSVRLSRYGWILLLAFKAGMSQCCRLRCATVFLAGMGMNGLADSIHGIMWFVISN